MSHRSVLTSKTLAWYALWQLFGIFATISPGLLGAYVIGMVLFVAICIAEYAALVTSEDFSAEISGTHTPELGKTSEVTCRIRPLSDRCSRISQLILEQPECNLLALKALPWRFVRSDERDGTCFKASGTAEAVALGFERMSVIRLSFRSPLGIWSRNTGVAADGFEYRVSPSLKKIPEQLYRETVQHQRLLLQGSRLVMRTRSAEQFYSIRRYQYPDSLRHIDQKKTAKYGQLMTRTFESTHNHHLVIALDVGRPMCGSIQGSAKHNYYLSASLILAQNALASGDRVSLLAFSQRPHLQIVRSRTMAPFRKVYRGDAALSAREEDSNYTLLGKIMPTLSSQRAIVVILSDLTHPYAQEALLPQVSVLSQRHVVVVLSLVDRNYDLHTRIEQSDPVNADFSELSSLLYSYWVQEQLELYSRKLADLGGAAVSVSEEYWMQTVARVYSTLRNSLRA